MPQAGRHELPANVMTRRARVSSSTKVVLVFPPVWETTAPYLSLPALTAYLRTHGVGTTQVDANMLFWDYLAGEYELQATYRICMDQLGMMRASSRLTPSEEFEWLMLERIAAMSEQQFVDGAKTNVTDRFENTRELAFIPRQPRIP